MDRKPAAAAAAQVRRGGGAGVAQAWDRSVRCFTPQTGRAPEPKSAWCGDCYPACPARKRVGWRDSDQGPVILETTVLGQPRLRLNGRPGPAVSFSQAAGCLWAALTFAGQVGVDAALPSEFEENYPWARAFRPAELDWARPLSGGDTAGAAALLWALKEAAVKALGVGFHLLDPLAVSAVSPRPWQGWVRVSVQAGQILPAWARPEGRGWLAIARNY